MSCSRWKKAFCGRQSAVWRKWNQLKVGVDPFMPRQLVLQPLLVLFLLMGACSPAHEVARKGRQFIIGMDAKTLQSCAGIPTRIKQLDSLTELYSYEIQYERTG